MKKCTFCKGTLRDGISTFTVYLGNCSQICTQCGETYYSTEVMQQLYNIAQSMQQSMTEIAVVNYRPAA